MSKLVVSNGGEIPGPENATVAVVGKCAPNKEPEKPFCLPNALRPEQDKLQATIILSTMHGSQNASLRENCGLGRIQSALGKSYNKRITSVKFNFGTSALFHVLVN